MPDEPTNHQAVYVVAAIVGAIALAIVAGEVWLLSQHQDGLPESLVALVGIIVSGLLLWMAPSPLKNPAQAPVVPVVPVPVEPVLVADPGIDVDPPHLAGVIMADPSADPFKT